MTTRTPEIQHFLRPPTWVIKPEKLAARKHGNKTTWIRIDTYTYTHSHIFIQQLPSRIHHPEFRGQISAWSQGFPIPTYTNASYVVAPRSPSPNKKSGEWTSVKWQGILTLKEAPPSEFHLLGIVSGVGFDLLKDRITSIHSLFTPLCNADRFSRCIKLVEFNLVSDYFYCYSDTHANTGTALGLYSWTKLIRMHVLQDVVTKQQNELLKNIIKKLSKNNAVYFISYTLSEQRPKSG